MFLRSWAMDRLTDPRSAGPMEPTQLRKAIARRSYCTLATVSPAGNPHAAGVLYAFAGDALFISTERSSRKARNVLANPAVGVTVPIRRLPVGPPSAVHFQGVAEVLDAEDVRPLAGELKAITSHGELDLPGGCFLRIALPARVHTYGLGMSLRRLLADPLDAGGVVDLAA
jgi:hypothetical protein